MSNISSSISLSSSSSSCPSQPLSRIPSCLFSMYAPNFITTYPQKALAEKIAPEIQSTTKRLPIEVLQQIALFSDFITLLNLALTSKYYFRIVFLNLPYSMEGVKISVETCVRIEKFRRKCLFQNFKNWSFSEDLYEICYSNIPIQVNNELFQEACATGVSRLVKDLLVDPRIDPTANKSESLFGASKNGHVDVVELLLNDGRANPDACHSRALLSASDNGHADVVALLLNWKIESAGSSR